VSLDREVAVKMILAGELAGKESLRMFQREAHAAANLHHPNIVPVYEIGEHETQHCFTMRFVPGGQTIADWAAARRGDHRAMAAAAARAARALAYAHSRGVLHRDLKPSKILWDDAAGRPGYARLGEELGMSEGAITVATHRMRRRYGELLREEIAATVTKPEEVEDELRHLMNVVSGGPVR
jgi:serine/threonine protein kinase